MRFKPRYSKKVFPFAPGIPWTIHNEKYIVPKIDKKIWDFALSDKEFIVTCFGGFLESFFSFSYFEAIHKIEPFRKMKWAGYEHFKPLCKMYGISYFDKLNDYKVVENYPAPIFMDSEQNAYFNVLNNYINFKSFNGAKSYINKEICLKQLFNNCLLDWEYSIPVFNGTNNKYEEWKKLNNFNDNKKFIVIFPNSWYSMYDAECLDWNDRQIRELSEMLNHMNISVVSCGSDINDIFYKSSKVARAPMDFAILLGLMKKSFGILSKDVDHLLVAQMISEKTTIFSNVITGSYAKMLDLFKNSEFLGRDNMIYTIQDIKPIDVVNICEDLV